MPEQANDAELKARQEIVRGAVALAGGVDNVARMHECSSENVRVWIRNGAVPVEHVIGLACETGWQVSPHTLSPSLYPHEDDGLPVERRSAPAHTVSPQPAG